MITVPGLAAEALGSFLTMHMGRRFGATHANLIALIPSAARLALECIGNSDALYHDVEHTMLALLWQIYSRRFSMPIHFRQCGHRFDGS
jgi:hypothetical protein